jgi:2,4-dienoyl-CoA reductase-like NADH-dependent reductase (Old Yellow Enzyme family)
MFHPRPMAFSNLLSPGRIGGLETRNRIAMAPMGSNLGEADGRVGERVIRYYEARARGGVGLIIVGVGAVAFPAGVCIPNQIAISDDRFLPGLQALTGRLHAHGAKVAIQLQHGGKVARQDMEVGRPMWVPSTPTLTGGDLLNDLTPDEVQGVIGHLAKPGARIAFHEMTVDDIRALVAQFADAAERARRAGFDGVEIHAAHGYLIAEFLSPASNKRTDDYGGGLENRARLLVEVIRAVKQRAGSDFPVWCRLDAREFRIDHGITLEDAQCAAELAAGVGADAIHVTAYADPRLGVAFTDAPLVHQPCGYVDFAAAIKRRVHIPIIAVGRIEPEEADALIGTGQIDFVAMARKLLADPELPRKLATGGGDVRPCIYGYTCVGNIYLNRSVSCAVNPETGHETDLELRPAAQPRHVLVAGGGPAGLEAARILALRGHRVTLCEAQPALGGAALLAARVYAPNGRLVDHLLAQVGTLPIDVRCGEPVTPALVRELRPDVLLIAVGARLVRPPITGIDRANVVDVTALGNSSTLLETTRGTSVAIIGGDRVGLEVAELLCERGHEVTVLAATTPFGVGMALPRRWRALHTLRERGVQLLGPTTVEACTDDGLVYRLDDEAQVLRADVVVVATGFQPDHGLADAVGGDGIEVHLLGDCRTPGDLEQALTDAARVAYAL